jgi:mRNA-degrading endonuclease toxin of MazEF toxin-antitoxin module
MKRGDLYWADLPGSAGRRPVVVVARGESLRRMRSVIVGPELGLANDSAVQCDGLQSIERTAIDSRPIGRLDEQRLELLAEAIRYALDVRCPPV